VTARRKVTMRVLVLVVVASALAVACKRERDDAPPATTPAPSPPSTPAPAPAAAPLQVDLGPPEPLPGDKTGKLTVRRGVVPLPKGPMATATIGDEGRYGEDYLFLTFDLDRDGAMELTKLDAPEQFHIFERSVTLDETTYAFSIDPDGASLMLVPAAKRAPPRPSLQPGSPAPDLALSPLSGPKTSLAALKGKVVLLDFWATSCAPCVKALPRLAALHAQHAAAGFELVSLAMPSDDLQAFLKAHPPGGGIHAVDDDDTAQSIYRIDRFPNYWLIGRDGLIVCAHCKLDDIEQTLPGLLAR